MISYQILSWTIGLFLLLSVPFTKCKKVHELMTDDEIAYVFQTSRDEVPEYERVAIEHSLHKRSISQNSMIKFKAFDKDVQIYLEPTDGILVGEDTPVWIAENGGKQTRYRMLQQGIMKEVVGVYQSLSDRASVVVRSREGRDLQFRGTIQNLTIIPLPDRIHQELEEIEKRKRYVTRVSGEIKIKRCHIVFKSVIIANQIAELAEQLKISAIKKNEDTSQEHDINNSDQALPNMVFPTILVTTDFNVAVDSADHSAYYDQIMYQLAFWNGVDLLFRHFDNPQIRLRIAGLIIGSDRSATSYLESNMVNRKLDIYAAYDAMQQFWNEMKSSEIFPLEASHIVATVTNLKILPIYKSASWINVKGTFESKKSLKTLHLSLWEDGLAATASICSEHIDTFNQPIILMKDDLGFGGIRTATHELGHILGAPHDDATTCSSAGGYLMSPYQSTTVNNSKWSTCSLGLMRDILRTRSCIHQPKEYYPSGKGLQRVLPGDLKTTHEQCQARGYDWACKTTRGICKVLRCFNEGLRGFLTGWKCQDSWSAAEGTKCGSGRYCIAGECLLIHRQLITKNELQLLLGIMDKVVLGSHPD